MPLAPFGSPGLGLARALSKLGFCSRAQAWVLIAAGRVRINGAAHRDPERRVDLTRDRLEVDNQIIRARAKLYLMLNKPRGLITTTSDEQGRETVFKCLPGFGAEEMASPAPLERRGSSPGRGQPRVFPVGRLDKASEGLLLMTNDTAWAAQITAPENHLDKIYHVQVDCLANESLTRRLQLGVAVDGDFLKAKRVTVLRLGARHSWLEIVLDQGKNRHIRRLLAALGVHVLRLVRVAIGPLQLGALTKGAFRPLTPGEVQSLAIGSRQGRRALGS